MNHTDLQSDCENCLGLCCVAPPFAKSAEFAHSKGEGEPCRNLDHNNRCTIHDDLTDQGYMGCIKFECFGAGQKVANHRFKNQSWRNDHLTAKRMFHVFFIVKAIHQKIKYLKTEDAPLNAQRISKLERLSSAPEEELLTLDLTTL